MDVVQIGMAVQRGLSIVCATCKRYWEGRDRGLPDPRCAASRPCGSPFARMTFPEYEGPIKDFAQWCFVCGSLAARGVAVRDSPRVIGLCDRHIGLLGSLSPVGLGANGVEAVDIVDSLRGRVPMRKVLGPPKKSLFQAMAETEAEWAEEAEKGRR